MKTDVVPIRLGKHWILLYAATISEFLPETPWLSVPGSTQLLPGVMTWRGRAIPVLDLRRALQVGTISPLDEYSRVLVLNHELGAVAVPVDGAREVRTLDSGAIRPPHVAQMPYAIGEVDSANEVLPVIEVDQILKGLSKAGA